MRTLIIFLAGAALVSFLPRAAAQESEADAAAKRWAESFDRKYCRADTSCRVEQSLLDNELLIVKKMPEAANAPSINIEARREELQRCQSRHLALAEERDRLISTATCAQIEALGRHCRGMPVLESRQPICASERQRQEDEERTKREREKAEQQAAQEKLASDPKLMVPLLSAHVCEVAKVRSAILKEIAAEKKYGRIGGAADYSKLYDYQAQLRTTDQSLVYLRSWLLDFKSKPLSCNEKRVQVLGGCIEIGEFRAWLSERAPYGECSSELAAAARELGPIAVLPEGD